MHVNGRQHLSSPISDRRNQLLPGYHCHLTVCHQRLKKPGVPNTLLLTEIRPKATLVRPLPRQPNKRQLVDGAVLQADLLDLTGPVWSTATTSLPLVSKVYGPTYSTWRTNLSTCSLWWRPRAKAMLS